jgi:alkylation response protein AidB-like acyl-CoA dehydrogenase
VTTTTADEQDELRRTVREFLADRAPEAELRRLTEAPGPGWDRAVWREAAAGIGLTGIGLPEEFGGAGDVTDLAVVLQETGRALWSAPYLPTVLAGQALALSGDTAARETWLPGVVAGEVVATVALGAPDGRWGPGDTAVRAAPAADGSWLLDGVAGFVPDGAAADLALVPALRPDGVLGLFAAASPAAAARPLATLDLTRRQARLEFRGFPARQVGPDDAADLAGRVLDVAAVLLAAEQAGGAGRVLDDAAGYARTRVQFGRPIGSFQAVKHKLADLLVEVESARTAAWAAARALAAGDPELRLVAALAQAYCSDAYARTARASIQIHGGIGFTWEHDAHLHLKRALSSAELFGTAAWHRERMARELVAREPVA